jgi:hypothetical protein
LDLFFLFYSDHLFILFVCQEMLLWLVGLAVVVAALLHYLIWKDADPAALKPSDFKWNPDDLGTSAPAPGVHLRIFASRTQPNLTPPSCPPPQEEKQDVPTREKIAIVGAGFCGLGIAGAFTVSAIATSCVRMWLMCGALCHLTIATVHM